MGDRKEFATKVDLKEFKDEIIHEFHIVTEGVTDHIKLLAEGHSGLAQRLDRVGNRIDHMEKENERQHIETRALIKSHSLNLKGVFQILKHRLKKCRNGKNRFRQGSKFNIPLLKYYFYASLSSPYPSENTASLFVLK